MRRLTETQIRFFKTNGYLVLRDALDKNLCAQACDRLWDDPPLSLRKDDPETWVGPIKEEEESAAGDNLKRNYRWQYRLIGSESFMVDMLPGAMNGIAHQLLGQDRFAPIQRVRGIYCTLPYGPEVERKPVSTHCDGHPFSFGCVAYIDDVPPDGGGFTVWPRSHRTFWRDFHSRYRAEYAPRYKEHAAAFASDHVYDQTYGQAGDVVLWHHRLGHMASHNYSRQIRKAVLCDYVLKDVDVLEEEPPGDDMWVDWSEEVREVDSWE